MYRIRFHGRGGEGMKTSSRILGTAFFLEGFEVQDAPRYGAERRGAPVFAYVRADRKKINERGAIHKPDLIVIADETLIHVTPETVFEGVDENTVILVISGLSHGELTALIPCKSRIININPQDKIPDYRYYLSTICASAAARLTGIISLESLITGISEELESVSSGIISDNINIARSIFDAMRDFDGAVSQSAETVSGFANPGFIDIPFYNASLSTPAIRSRSTSLKSPTGSWRTVRPVINTDKCSRCMLCNVYCPDSAISTGDDSFPCIDYSHCKGCLICAEICPSHAIEKCSENLFSRVKAS